MHAAFSILPRRVRRQRADPRAGVDVDPHDLAALELADVGADRTDDAVAEVDGHCMTPTDVTRQRGRGGRPRVPTWTPGCFGPCSAMTSRSTANSTRVGMPGRRPTALHPTDDAAGQLGHLRRDGSRPSTSAAPTSPARSPGRSPRTPARPAGARRRSRPAPAARRRRPRPRDR